MRHVVGSARGVAAEICADERRRLHEREPPHPRLRDARAATVAAQSEFPSGAGRHSARDPKHLRLHQRHEPGVGGLCAARAGRGRGVSGQFDHHGRGRVVCHAAATRVHGAGVREFLCRPGGRAVHSGGAGALPGQRGRDRRDVGGGGERELAATLHQSRHAHAGRRVHKSCHAHGGGGRARGGAAQRNCFLHQRHARAGHFHRRDGASGSLGIRRAAGFAHVRVSKPGAGGRAVQSGGAGVSARQHRPDSARLAHLHPHAVAHGHAHERRSGRRCGHAAQCDRQQQRRRAGRRHLCRCGQRVQHEQRQPGAAERDLARRHGGFLPRRVRGQPLRPEPPLARAHAGPVPEFLPRLSRTGRGAAARSVRPHRAHAGRRRV